MEVANAVSYQPTPPDDPPRANQASAAPEPHLHAKYETYETICLPAWDLIILYLFT